MKIIKNSSCTILSTLIGHREIYKEYRNLFIMASPHSRIPSLPSKHL